MIENKKKSEYLNDELIWRGKMGVLRELESEEFIVDWQILAFFINPIFDAAIKPRVFIILHNLIVFFIKDTALFSRAQTVHGIIKVFDH